MISDLDSPGPGPASGADLHLAVGEHGVHLLSNLYIYMHICLGGSQ